MKKTCTKCRQTLPASEFHRDRRRPDGLRSWCKECANLQNRERYRSSRWRRIEARRKHLEWARRWWAEHGHIWLEKRDRP